MAKIVDSGERRSFETGAVRDMSEGKGRCDLMPLDIIAEILDRDEIIGCFYSFMQTGKDYYLYLVLEVFIEDHTSNQYNAMLELAIHYEDGWQEIWRT